MPRRRPKRRPQAPPEAVSATAEPPKAPPTPRERPSPPRLGTALAVFALLATQWSLAVLSLIQENPTVDEVVHLPAGVSYWQTGTFKLYAHNPPLIKLIAALPALRAGVETEPLYQVPLWGWDEANKAAFAHGFAFHNAARYFELFTSARLLMPTFAVLGGLFVFDWSRRRFGAWGGLISLALWCLCPNVIAHSRLVTTDIGATVLGFAATYAFWFYLKDPSPRKASLSGIMLGVAQLAKFSSLVLLVIWPALGLIDAWRRLDNFRPRRLLGAFGHAGLMLGFMILVINLGYGFEGFGRPLGSYQFTSDLLTVDRARPVPSGSSPTGRNALEDGLLQYRVNRFRATPLGALPVPLPFYYVSGFDEQKTEAEGIPYKATMHPDQARRLGAAAEEIKGYPVFLDGELRDQSWWFYYLFALAYKIPEGTWLIVLGSIAVGLASRRARGSILDETALWMPSLVILGLMSFGTNIALGLRYVLPIAPYVFVSAGRLAPWAAGLRQGKRLAITAIALSLTTTAAACVSIHPHPLAYFNWVSGGPARGSEHLIDSNLDWGQDLVGLKRWWERNAAGRPLGLAYFGQVPPALFDLRGESFEWFLPPALPGGWKAGNIPPRYLRKGTDTPPEPGLYAVSASLLRGLPWRVYDRDRIDQNAMNGLVPYEAGRNAFRYFEGLEPIGHVGYSIWLFEIDERAAKRLARLWRSDAVAEGTR